MQKASSKATQEVEDSLTKLPPDEVRNLLVGLLVDILENDLENLGTYLEYVGFDASALGKPSDLLPAWLGHYRIGQGTYDAGRAAIDLATWPPVARRIFELQQAESETLAK